ncbi:CO/xanthine dehydrogenase FAD-binding subunit [Streptomyces sp. Amel2xB2]|uniref:Carbon monoxide dehydrogenase n=1 Tax=Streptomyces nanshensis TaxID=518642 RepID=A0A1E7L864_9ACTN|nr:MULTISPECIES: xanthine dehydrogenase family protein subunit M [Streptomyces]OEV12301.1 carbon monoxide dehydrogenase [Streptomyces nanshensis]RAJ56620.1 CO/xanthine dehydrogenase FAD-binding subunit [Streptomyces sp. Amel2xB2]
MEFLRPARWEEALAAKAEHPSAVPIAGGTDVMVEINFDQRRPAQLLDLNRVAELHEWETGEESVALGACVPYTRIIRQLRRELPGLALAAHTVGSPQIRNRGSVGGNLGAASPAGDSHPPLLTAGAEVEAESVRGSRRIPVEEFFTGVKRNALAEDELIRRVHIKKADGPQQFSKIGTRNAMVIAVCGFSVALHPADRTVRAAVGSAAPTPFRASAAEDFLTAALEEERLWESRAVLRPSVAARFAELCSAACSPIDDVRGSAAYRRHAVGVMARRTLGWVWEEYRSGGDGAGAGTDESAGGSRCA